MQAVFATAHTLAAVGLFHSIKKGHQHEEEWITLLLVAVIAVTSLLGFVLGLGGSV